MSHQLTKLPRRFYLRPTIVVARELLGSYLVRRVGRQRLVGRIVEVEAYVGRGDPASHSFRGKTKRNEVMFSRGGTLYVYFTYGMHFCSNVVTEEEGKGCAVLLRAVEPVEGWRMMIRNRELRMTARAGAKNDRALLSIMNVCNGPSRLCQAFAIARRENGIDLCGDEIWIGRAKGMRRPRFTIASTSRVGITDGTHHRWRFFIKGDPYVSPGRPAPSASRRKK